jgi:mutual gliding-motility protein MglA
MVFFNYATMQMAAKIVYYGPGLCGKTTNLHQIYSKTSPQSRGEMVSLETETDRTLFFDLLPIDVGVIGGFKTRLQLYTVPGQVFYNTTRKLVLKGVDGIVFVADSQQPILDANVESLKNLGENLAEIGVAIEEIPTVLQLNKRDLPNIVPVDVMLNALDPDRRMEHVEAIAAQGVGVFETLKLISKLTLRTLRRRMTGEEPLKAAPTSRLAQFRVQSNESSPNRTIAQSTPIPHVSATALADAIAEPYTAPQARSVEAEGAVATADVDRNILAHAPVPDHSPAREVAPEIAVAAPVEEEAATHLTPETALHESESAATPSLAPESMAQEVVAQDPAPEAVAEVPEFEMRTPVEHAPVQSTYIESDTAPGIAIPEPEVDFNHTDKPQKVEDVKTVKVRSSVDVMAELEALRKRATNTGPRAPRRDPLADLAALRPRREVLKTANLSLPADMVSRAKSVRVTLSFEDGDSNVVGTQEQQLELGDTADIQNLSVNLKIDLA